ncbi:hypothetical protein [Xanthomonas phage RTH11]|nr:hypothetical protein [Xanthomonas phage RTH11]
MSNIARHLRELAAARRVSQEAATDPTVQGQEGNLDENELKQVADAAAADVDTTETSSADGADPTNTEPPAVEGGDEGAGEPEAAAEGDAAADTAPPAEEGAAAPEAGAEETPVEEIQTPAEAELAQIDGGPSGEEPGAADADLSAAEPPAIEGGEEAAGEPAADAGAVEGGEGGELPAADAGEPAAAEPAATDAPVVDDAAAAEVPADATPDAAVVDEPAPPVADLGEDAGAAAEPNAADAADTAGPKEAPAATPEAVEKSDAVMEVVELTEAAAEASSAEEVLQQARGIEDGLTELADTAEAVNEAGGVDMQSYAMLELAAKAISAPMCRGKINFGISMEGFIGGERQLVSLEDIQTLIGDMQLIQPELEREALDSLDRMVCSLKDALPSARERIQGVVARSKAKTAENSGSIEMVPELQAALSVNGTVPDDLTDGLFDYIELGKSLVNSYTPAAFRAATEASLLTNSVEFNSVEGFWEKVGQRIDTVADPRCLIPASLLSIDLPGGRCLFSEAGGGVEASNPTAAKLYEYTDGLVPLESTVAVRAGEGAGSSQYNALTNAKITSIGAGFLDVLDMDKICCLLEQGGKLWPDAQGAIRHLREVLNGAPQDIAQIAGGDFPQLVKFLEVNYSLATWPLLNYLTNMVFTANAFVMLAELSLKATGEVAAEPVVEEAPLDPVTDVAPESTPEVDPAAEPAATDDVAPPLPEEGTDPSVSDEPPAL